jgi:hypothetical protein
MPVVSLRRRTQEAELLDGPLLADAGLAGNLRDLARINRWTGGDLLRRRALQHLLKRAPSTALTMLDVGGGRGDGVARAVRWVRLRHFDGRGILLDSSAPILRLAATRQHTGVRLVRGDGSRLPFRDHSVDIASCSLLLHHLSIAQVRVVLGEMARVARVGIIIDDLLRSHLGYLGAVLMGRLLTRNRLTRHDGPLSVRRAFRLREWPVLLASAGICPVWQATIPGYRTVLAARPISDSQP